MKFNLYTLAKIVRALGGSRRGRVLCAMFGHVKPARADVQFFHAAAKKNCDNVGPLTYSWTQCPRCGEPWL